MIFGAEGGPQPWSLPPSAWDGPSWEPARWAWQPGIGWVWMPQHYGRGVP